MEHHVTKGTRNIHFFTFVVGATRAGKAAVYSSLGTILPRSWSRTPPQTARHRTALRADDRSSAILRHARPVQSPIPVMVVDAASCSPRSSVVRMRNRDELVLRWA